MGFGDHQSSQYNLSACSVQSIENSCDLDYCLWPASRGYIQIHRTVLQFVSTLRGRMIEVGSLS